MPNLELAPDHMRAELWLEPGERLTPEALKSLLSELGIRHGLNAEALGATLEGPAVLPVALGTPAVNGTPGRIEYSFRTTPHTLSPLIDQDGRADYRNLGLVASVQPGQVLARRIPPTPGHDGRTVTGVPVKAAPGRDVRLRAGKGAELSEDGALVRAAIAGNPHLHGSVVLVSEQYVIPSDVSLATGNIEFEGDLVIAGSVQQQMLVRATGDVWVHGSVEGGRIVAGGSIRVQGGVRHQASLEAGGDIFARFVEGSRLRGGGALTLQEDLLHSTVEMAGPVKASQVIGGTLQLCERLECWAVGARMGTPTIVIALPPAGLLDERLAIAEERATLQAHLERLSPRLREAGAALKDPHQQHPDLEVFRKALELSAQLCERDAELAQQERAIAEQLWTRRPALCAREAIHPGVSVQLGEAHMGIQESLPAGQLRERDGRIQLLALA